MHSRSFYGSDLVSLENLPLSVSFAINRAKKTRQKPSTHSYVLDFMKSNYKDRLTQVQLRPLPQCNDLNDVIFSAVIKNRS